MKFRNKRVWSLVTAFIMAVTIFGCTSFSFAEPEVQTNDTSGTTETVDVLGGTSGGGQEIGDPAVNEDADEELEGEGGETEEGVIAESADDESVETEADPPVVLVAPTSPKAAGGKYRYVTLSWAKVDPANGGTVSYEIYDGENLLSTVTALTYTVKNLSPRAKTYTYAIKAIETDAEGTVTGQSELAAFPAAKTADFSAQRLDANKIFADPGYKAVLLQWNKLDGATGYRIYRRQGGERGNIDNAKCSDGRTLKTYRSKTTRKYERIVTPGSFELVETVSQPKTSTVNYRDGGLKVLNHSYAYFYQYMIVPIYEDADGIIVSSVYTDANKKLANKNNYGTNTKIHVIKQNTILPMYVLYRVKVNKPYYNTYKPSDLKHRGRFSKGHLVIGFSRTEGRFQFYEKKNVSDPSKTYWFAQKNSKPVQGYYINNGNKNNLNRKDWKTGYSKKSVLDYVNHAGLSSKTGYLIWVSKYAQHVYIFKGSKGNWKLVNSGKNAAPGWSNLCASGSVALQSRNGQFTIYGKQYVAKRSKFYYYYVSKLHGTVRLHTIMYKKGAKFGSKKYYNKALGNPMSNGCVRMRPKTAQWVYTKIPKKTKALVY